MIYPLPAVLVTCGDSPENYNMLTVSWVGTTCTNPAMCYISVRPERHSYPIIKESGEFVINLATADMIRAVDYCGIYTGAKVNKFEKCGLTPEPAHEVSCPLIAQSPLSLECRVTQIIPLGSHDMFLADILHVHVDESLLDQDGKLHLERAHLAAFAHGEYFELGKKIGKFGFSATKKKSHPPKKHGSH
jgi:flavin reductase (DIM6/NTAB) family NADH-FMN oxidoreductase RutF